MKLYQHFISDRMLIVDDEEFCISAMRAVLFSIGMNVEYQVDYCITGKEALEQLQKTYQHGMSYQLIFTDFNMPVMNGIEATFKMRKYLQEIRGLERQQQPKIVGVTGHILESFKNEGREAGMDEILGKPLYSETLKNILEQLK